MATSSVRTDIPASPVALTKDIRDNFVVIKQELEYLMGVLEQNEATNAPAFTGLMDAEDATFSGDVSVGGAFAPTTETPIATSTPTLTFTTTPYSGVTGGITFTKYASGIVTLSGSLVGSITNLTVPRFDNVTQLAANTLPTAFRPTTYNILVPQVDVAFGGSYAIAAVMVDPSGNIYIGYVSYQGGAGPHTTNMSIKYSGCYKV